MTKEQRSKMMKYLFETIFSHEVKVKLAPEVVVNIGKERIVWKQTGGLRGYEANLDGKQIVIMEQNPASFSQAALLAKMKFNCAWIWHQKKPWPAREREWIAFIIRRTNGEVAVFAGKHIMTRVYYLMRDEINEKRERIMFGNSAS